jgi:hypothetical protein
MTVARSLHGTAVVTKIIPGGQAAEIGVVVGDVVVGVGDKWIDGYEQFVSTVQAMEYPKTFILRRVLIDIPDKTPQTSLLVYVCLLPDSFLIPNALSLSQVIR